MKKLFGVLIALMMVALPLVSAVGIGGDVGIIITPEQFAPRVFLSPHTRVVLDDCTEPGAVSGCGQTMVERVENYAFEGEQIAWNVLVWDKNGKEKISDVYVKVLQAGQTMEFVEANCVRNDALTGLDGMALYEGEELISWKDTTMRWYTCTFTVETPASMHGEYKIVAEAEDVNGQFGESAESEFWFLNPVIALGIDGSLNFGTVRPGATVKSSTLHIKNNAEANSGVLLDMFIAGTDFYDPSHSGAMCPTSNVLKLSNFRYYATLGAYSTCLNAGVDADCYDTIPYFMDGVGATTVNNNMQRIIDGPSISGPYKAGNVLSPGADMSINFKLSMPEPCNGGSFSQGSFKIFGEAI